MVVPMRTDRATRAYRVLEELVAGAGADPTARPSDRETGL
jgi:hypothetical protein